MLQIPPHIEKIKFVGQPVDFEWIEDNITDYYNHLSKQLTHKLMQLSPRAGLALAAGMAEWVVWRLDGLEPYRDVADFAEACWASVIDPDYTIEWSRQGKILQGPVLGPQLIAARSLDKVFLGTWRRESTIRNCQYLAFLCQHVWKRRKVFKEWLLFVFDRLAALYPISPVTQDYHEMRGKTGEEPFEFGDIVPREAMDPDFTLDQGEVPNMLNAFLQGLNPDTNRFLRTPREMIDLGFKGTPYRFTS